MHARGIFASGAVVILAVSATTILLLHPKHGSSFASSDASTSFDPTTTPTTPPPPLALDACAGKPPWISGPANDRLEQHLGAADVRAPDEIVADPSLGLNVLFSRRATVAEANAALCEANVDVIAVLLHQRLLAVRVAKGAAREDVHRARGKLIAHRFVEAVAPAILTSLEDGLAFKAESVRLGFNRCDWASGQLAKKLAIAKPTYCYQSERREIDGREILYAAVRADEDCAVVAVVDDDGVFPHATRCKPSSRFAKLAETELTALKHASLGTEDGKKAVETMLRRIEQPLPK